MQKSGRFNRQGNRGTKRCRLCKALKQEANIERSTGLCENYRRSCFDLAGLENEHSDTDHEFNRDAVGGVHPDCPVCHPELEALYTPEGRVAAAQGGVR